MRRSCVIGCVLLALFAAPNAFAKEFASLAIVGSDGGSSTIRLQPMTLDGLFAGPATRNLSGGYVRVYPLGPTGHVGVPGRFYPATGALCLSWDQAAVSRSCHRPPLALRRLIDDQELALYSGVGPTLAKLESVRVTPPVVRQLRVAFELAFDRSRLARRAATPARCLPFFGEWRGGAAGRSRRFCISRRGVHAGGLLHPLGIEPWRLASSNRR